MKLAAKAALTSAAVLTTSFGFAASAHATTSCTPSNGYFSFCSSATYNGSTNVSVTLYSSHYTDYRYTITWDDWIAYSNLFYPGQTVTIPHSGWHRVQVCVQESAYGKECTDWFAPG